MKHPVACVLAVAFLASLLPAGAVRAQTTSLAAAAVGAPPTPAPTSPAEPARRLPPPASAGTVPFTFTAQAGTELCAGSFVYLVTVENAPTGEAYWTWAHQPIRATGNVKRIKFLVDEFNLAGRTTNQIESGASGGLLLVALAHPSEPATISVSVSVNGATYQESIAVPVAQSTVPCGKDPFAAEEI